MRVTTKGEYGLRALVELASHEEGLLPSATIAARQKIPENYLSQLLLTLRKGGLVESVRGPAGGHMLARPADQINLGEALDVLEIFRVATWSPLRTGGFRGARYTISADRR